MPRSTATATATAPRQAAPASLAGLLKTARLESYVFHFVLLCDNDVLTLLLHSATQQRIAPSAAAIRNVAGASNQTPAIDATPTTPAVIYSHAHVCVFFFSFLFSFPF